MKTQQIFIKMSYFDLRKTLTKVIFLIRSILKNYKNETSTISWKHILKNNIFWLKKNTHNTAVFQVIVQIIAKEVHELKNNQ